MKINNMYWKKKLFYISDYHDIPFRATLINTLLWTVSCLVGLFFAISTTEISPLNKAMSIYFCAHFTILVRHPCMLVFSFRANVESRRLDMKEERERRRNIVIQEAAKERASRKENATNRIEIQLEEIQLEEIQLKTLVLLDLEMRLASFDKRLPDFGLPTPTAEEINQVEHVTSTQPAVIREELDYDYEDLLRTVEACIPTLTPEQLKVYEEIMDAVKNDKALCVFLAARGGCGKTYLLNLILAAVRSLEPGGCVALAMATTGIAATLLQLGRTFHSRMKAPLDPDESSTLSISAQSPLAQLIRMAKLFLIDEATMLNKALLEAMDRTLRDILMQPDLPFGGKIVILAGDFKQCLPVIPGASRAGIVKQAVNKSYLWQHFQILELTRNMRVHASGDPDLEAFDKWGVDIGNGVESSIKIPINMISTRITPNSKENPTTELKGMEQFCDKIFPNLSVNIEEPNWIDGRAILAPTNKEVQMLNEMLSSKLPGASAVGHCVDGVEKNFDFSHIS